MPFDPFAFPEASSPPEEEDDDDNYCHDCGEELGWGGECETCGTLEHGYERDENPLERVQREVIRQPFLHLLREGGRMWSAEIEVNNVRPIDLPYPNGGYTSDGGYGQVIATDDCTVDAEIKLSRMLDGEQRDACIAANTYVDLRAHDAVCGYNTGHHVHIDASRLALLPWSEAEQVVCAAATIGLVCARALTELGASGYHEHRGDHNSYGDAGWAVGSSACSDRYSLHGCRLRSWHGYSDGGATIEYRVPNGTVEEVRGHGHVAIAMGLIDLAERAMLDRQRSAVEALTACREAIGFDTLDHASVFFDTYGARSWTTEKAGAFLARNLNLHSDSYRVLEVLAASSPTSGEHKQIWADARRKVAA